MWKCRAQSRGDQLPSVLVFMSCCHAGSSQMGTFPPAWTHDTISARTDLTGETLVVTTTCCQYSTLSLYNVTTEAAASTSLRMLRSSRSDVRKAAWWEVNKRKERNWQTVCAKMIRPHEQRRKPRRYAQWRADKNTRTHTNIHVNKHGAQVTTLNPHKTASIWWLLNTVLENSINATLFLNV